MTSMMTSEKTARTRENRESDADRCRREGWGPGTRLVGSEGYGETVIESTAVGESLILAHVITHDGADAIRAERVWTSTVRDGQPAQPNARPARRRRILCWIGVRRRTVVDSKWAGDAYSNCLSCGDSGGWR